MKIGDRARVVKTGAALAGVPKSEDHRKKISAAQRSMKETCSCGATYRPCHRHHHARKCSLQGGE